jgi:hypothetical protein
MDIRKYNQSAWDKQVENIENLYAWQAAAVSRDRCWRPQARM